MVKKSFLALLSHWYQDWVKMKHAEMQSETRGVQSFGAKPGAQYFKNQIESPDCLLSNAL